PLCSATCSTSRKQMSFLAKWILANGKSGGQTVKGGTANNENLVFYPSTAAATGGKIQFVVRGDAGNVATMEMRPASGGYSDLYVGDGSIIANRLCQSSGQMAIDVSDF